MKVWKEEEWRKSEEERFTSDPLLIITLASALVGKYGPGPFRLP